mmetsp:Transcript_14731/g.26166  ORF Transcript_14731/g.26166 Transcript_14731/m.26166 type:complete len:705 (-) Transcript_14731:101-2215(-)
MTSQVSVAVAVLLLSVSPSPVASIKSVHTGLKLAVDSELTFDEAGAKERPVTKVIDLLKDMLKQLEKEAEDDEDVYDKLACWCQTNEKEKTESIEAAESRISELTNKISELTANSARLSTEIKNAEAEKAENEASLDKATAMRQKELAEFNAEEKDMLESLAALKAAITVIGSHHSSLLQVSRSKLRGVASSLQRNVQKHASLFTGVLTHSQKRAFNSFIQDSDYFDAEPTFKQSYAPESGAIFGILQQMKETFESNLSTAQKDELAAQKAFEELKAAKEDEIASNAAVIDKKTMELATTNEKNAQASEDMDDTKASLSADEQFLASLKEKCSMTDADWEKRQNTRSQEMEAVSKAIAILNADDAHALFSKTFNPSMFIQKASSRDSARRMQASKLLAAAAKRVQNPRLAALAVKARLDAFVAVKKAIDEMIEQLMKEKKDEIKKKDFCVAEAAQLKKMTTAKNREKADLEAEVADLDAQVKALTDAIAALKAENAEMAKELEAAGKQRDAENTDIQMEIADSRATQKVLTSALGVLESFYKKQEVFLQRQEPAGPPPPPGMTEYVKSESSGGVMELLESIIAEAKTMESEAARREKESQDAYETFVKDTKDSVAANEKNIVNKSEEKAKAEKDLVEANEDMDAVKLALEKLGLQGQEMDGECTFLMKNYQTRQTAFDEEMEALKQAKAILSGAKFVQVSDKAA